MRALWSEVIFSSFLGPEERHFAKMDIYKCPKSICDYQTQTTFFLVFMRPPILTYCAFRRAICNEYI
jgi:hypothetical protein